MTEASDLNRAAYDRWSVTGSQARFVDPETGQELRPVNHAHTDEEVMGAALRAGLRSAQSLDIAGDEDLATLNADWRRHIGRPMIRIWVFKRTAATV